MQLRRPVFVSAIAGWLHLAACLGAAAEVPDTYVFPPSDVKTNDDALGNMADRFAEAIPIWQAGDVPIADYQTMALDDGTILAAQCWDSYEVTVLAGHVIACAFVGLPGSTGTTSISPNVALTTNAGEKLPADSPVNEVAATIAGIAAGYPLAVSPFPAPIPMSEGAVAVLAWQVPTGFAEDVAIQIPDTPSGYFWVPQVYRVGLS